MALDDALREIVREEVRAAVADLADELPSADLEPEEELRSRVWRMAPETRLPLSDVAEVLGCSERTVRRHASGETSAPRLPLRDGPAGKICTAGELRDWIQDAERAERFRESA